MILTIEEAQRILRKVFQDTAGDVRIDGSENATASVDNYMPEIVAGVAHVRGKSTPSRCTGASRMVLVWLMLSIM